MNVQANQEVWVNNVCISEQEILQEMQYHPAESQERAKYLAAQALVVRTLLKERACGLDDADSLSDDALLDLLVEREIDFPTPQEEECMRYYEAHRDQFVSPKRYGVSHILLSAAPDDREKRDAIAAQADDLLKQLQQSPERFAELAARYSDCSSKSEGGELGQVTQKMVSKTFYDHLERNHVGLVSYPVITEYGIHLIFIHNIIPGKPFAYEVVKGKIQRYLEERAARTALHRYVATLVEKATISGITFESQDVPLMQ